MAKPFQGSKAAGVVCGPVFRSGNLLYQPGGSFDLRSNWLSEGADPTGFSGLRGVQLFRLII